MKILLPVDASEYTKRMLAYLGAHDELLGRGHDYTVFTAVSPLPSHAARFLDPSVVDDHHREQVETAFKPIRAFAAQQGSAMREVHAVAFAAQAIADLADSEKIDLIVMGTHGHSALGNLVLGSVATGVLARSQAPVLLIR